MVLIFFFRGVIVCKVIHSEPVVMSTKSSIQEGVSLAKDPSIKALADGNLKTQLHFHQMKTWWGNACLLVCSHGLDVQKLPNNNFISLFSGKTMKYSFQCQM